MPLVVSLPPEEEAQFEAWAAQQGEAVQQAARAVFTTVAERSRVPTEWVEETPATLSSPRLASLACLRT